MKYLIVSLCIMNIHTCNYTMQRTDLPQAASLHTVQVLANGLSSYRAKIDGLDLGVSLLLPYLPPAQQASIKNECEALRNTPLPPLYLGQVDNVNEYMDSLNNSISARIIAFNAHAQKYDDLYAKICYLITNVNRDV